MTSIQDWLIAWNFVVGNQTKLVRFPLLGIPLQMKLVPQCWDPRFRRP
jgi:hypothetical protein